MKQISGEVPGPRPRARRPVGLAVCGTAAAWVLAACLLPPALAENGDVLKISRILETRNPTDLTFQEPTADRTEGTLWAATRLDGKLYEINLGLEEVLRTIDNPHGLAPFPNVILSWGIAHRASSDTLFVLAQSGMEWLVKETRPDGVVIEASAFAIQPPDPATSNLRGLTFDASGELWYLDVNNDLVVRTDLTGRATAMFSLPGDDPPSTIIRGEGLAFFQLEAGPRLYVAYGDALMKTASRLLQLTPNGDETGVHIPLTGVPAEAFHGFEIYRTGPQIRVAQVTGDGAIVELEHAVPTPAPPSRLECRLTSANHVALGWVNHGRGAAQAYDGEIVVVRNGSPVTTLPGTATSFVDASPSEGRSRYALQASSTPGGELSPPGFPCEVTVGPGGLVGRATFAGKKPYDIARDPRQGDLYVTDPVEGKIYRYSASLEHSGEIPSPVASPGGICFVPTIDILTLANPGEDPSFTTFENILAVGRTDSSLVSIMTLEGEVKTTLSFELSGGTLGGLTWVPESQEFVAIELTRRERLVINRGGRLEEACFPRSLLPPVPLPVEQQLSFGITYDVLQQTFLSSHDDGLIRELFKDVDAQGGCVITDFSFGLKSLGGASDQGSAFRGIEISDNTLIVCGAESNTLFQVLIHPFTTAFRRGDADRDETITLTDAVQIATYLFSPGGAMLKCLDAADTNDDGILDVSDPVYLLFYLFLQGPAPPIPFDDVGTDPTFRDNLGCGE